MMRADMKILITDLNNPNNVLAIPKKSQSEISATAEISTDSESLDIIEYQFFCFISPILQAKVWQKFGIGLRKVQAFDEK